MSRSMASQQSRKRPAPDSEPPTMPQYQAQSYAPEDQLTMWNNVNNMNVAYNPILDPNEYPNFQPSQQQLISQQQPQQQHPYQTSNALARRQNNALVPARARLPPGSSGWEAFDTGNNSALVQSEQLDPDKTDNIETLREIGRRVRDEAPGKRKSIPPFIQKLESYLENDKYHDLIRWTQDGRSFVVVNQEEFAEKFIPELFKHNNYASFVRQLNMYGFHKVVGLSDNSMRASEQKSKAPNEYSHKYFRRGEKDLLWLVTKIKTTKKGANAKANAPHAEHEGDSDDGELVEEIDMPEPNNPALPRPQSGQAQQAGPLQKRELAIVKEQLSKFQTQQNELKNMIGALKSEQNNLYKQAAVFQDMHNRHENSINAILNFLANVFRKSLEEQGGAQSVTDLLASIIPNGGAQRSPDRNVVDLSDFGDLGSNTRTNLSSASPPPKRPMRLLPGIPDQGKASTVAPSPASVGTEHGPGGFDDHGQRVTEVFDTSPSDAASSPQYTRQNQSSSAQGDMMRFINDTNARNTPNIDLSDVAANTPVSMSNDQRNRLVDTMARNIPQSNNQSPPTQQPSTSDNAVTPPAAQGGLSLSPFLGSSTLPPSAQDISQLDPFIDHIQKTQQDQDQRLADLNNLLVPHSPTGQIPGLEGLDDPTVGNNFFPSQEYDINDFLNPGAFDPSIPFGGGDADGLNNFDFGLDTNGTTGPGATGVSGQGQQQTFASPTVDGGGDGGQTTAEDADDEPSPTVTEEIERTELNDKPHDSKRRRQG